MRFSFPRAHDRLGAVRFRRALTAVLLTLPAGAACWWGVGCGPSVQSVYEGNVRFEHCYRLDLDPNIAAGHRETCWRTYVRRYHAGQTKDRLDYARRRARALASGDTSRPTFDLDGGDGAAPVSPPEAPIPTSIHKPPPPTAKPPPPGAGAPDAAAASTDAMAPPPESECAADCLASWRRCGGPSCDGDAGGKVGDACKACSRDYRRCMQRCFR